jgi:helix-turn-helix protein
MGQKRLSTQKLERKIIALSEEHPRYGYRRITALLRRKGKPLNNSLTNGFA